jgi:hypothetical protein
MAEMNIEQKTYYALGRSNALLAKLYNPKGFNTNWERLRVTRPFFAYAQAHAEVLRSNKLTGDVLDRLSKLSADIDFNVVSTEPAVIRAELQAITTLGFHHQRYADDKGVAATLASEIRRAGLTQEAVAERMGIPQSRVSEHVNGKKTPRYETLRRYEEALGCVKGTLTAMVDGWGDGGDE